MKAKCFIGIANCCKVLKMLVCAIRILRKALEYGNKNKKKFKYLNIINNFKIQKIK